MYAYKDQILKQKSKNGVVKNLERKYLLAAMLALLLSITMLGSAIKIKQTYGQSESKETLIRIGGMSWYGYSPWTLNPFLCMLTYCSEFSFPIYGDLTRIDANGDIELNLAKSLTTTNGSVWICTLVKNTTFHDGTPFNSSSVKWSWDTLLNDSRVDPYWEESFRISDFLESVEVVGDYTVVFHLKRPMYYFPYYIDRVPMLKPRTNMSDPYALPIGTGPFKLDKLEDWVLDANFTPVNLTLIANDDYFKGRPDIDKIFYPFDVPEEQLYDSVMENAIDLAGCVIATAPPSAETTAALASVPGVTRIDTDKLHYETLGYNLAKDIVNNTKVREAFDYAIDEQNMSDTSNGNPAYSPIPPVLETWHNPDVVEYLYDSTKAEELLDEAGYPRVPEKTGWRFPLTIKVREDLEWRVKNAELVRDYLRAVGVDCSVELVSKTQYFNDLESGNFTLIMSGFIFGYDPYGTLEIWHTEDAFNYWNYNSTMVNSLLDEMGTSMNLTRIKEICDEIQLILSRDRPVEFLYYPRLTSVFNNDFYGFVSRPAVSPADAYSLEKVKYAPALSEKPECPVNPYFIDSEGRITGRLPNGTVVVDIPESEYVEDQNLIKIRNPLGNYTLEVYGTANGTYSLETCSISLEYKNMHISPGTIREGQIREYRITVSPDGSVSVINCAADLNDDNKINIYDVVRVCICYGSEPGHPNWNAIADIAPPLNKINIYDVVQVCADYGKKWSE